MAEVSLFLGFIGFALSVTVFVVFLVMGSNIGTAVKLLRSINQELKEANLRAKATAKATDNG